MRAPVPVNDGVTVLVTAGVVVAGEVAVGDWVGVPVVTGVEVASGVAVDENVCCPVLVVDGVDVTAGVPVFTGVCVPVTVEAPLPVCAGVPVPEGVGVPVTVVVGVRVTVGSGVSVPDAVCVPDAVDAGDAAATVLEGVCVPVKDGADVSELVVDTVGAPLDVVVGVDVCAGLCVSELVGETDALVLEGAQFLVLMLQQLDLLAQPLCLLLHTLQGLTLHTQDTTTQRKQHDRMTER